MSNDVYEIPKKSFQHYPVTLLYVTEATYDKDWHSTFHSHLFTEFIFVTQGEGHFNLPGRKVPIQAGQIVVVNENVEHTETSDSENILEYIALGIQGALFKEKDNPSDKPFTLFRLNQDREKIWCVLGLLVDEVKKRKEPDSLIINNLMEILLSYLFKHHRITIDKVESHIFNNSIATVKQYMDLNFQEAISLEQLAEVGHMNKYYLAHTFKKSIGLSPIEYLNSVRLKKSKYILETTNHPISTVAGITGYSSASYFSQAFRRAEGISPLVYRKQQKEKLK